MSKFNKKNKEELPKDYFVKFGEKMLNKTLEEELFDTADFPILNAVEKSKDFTIPNQYFENLKITKSNSKPKSFSLYRALAIAASILIVGILFTLSTKSDTGTEKQEIASLEELDYYLEDSDALELSDILELQELYSDELSNEFLLDDIDNEILIEYLLEESDAYDLVEIY